MLRRLNSGVQPVHGAVQYRWHGRPSRYSSRSRVRAIVCTRAGRTGECQECWVRAVAPVHGFAPVCDRCTCVWRSGVRCDSGSRDQFECAVCVSWSRCRVRRRWLRARRRPQSTGCPAWSKKSDQVFVTTCGRGCMKNACAQGSVGTPLISVLYPATGLHSLPAHFPFPSHSPPRSRTS